MLREINEIQYVYHYTSFEVLFAILEQYRKSNDKDKLMFRASNIFKVNDPSEMQLGYDVIKSYLPEYEKQKTIPSYLKLSEVYEHLEYEKKCIEDYLESIKGNIVKIGNIPYVICFSANEDYLPMWSLYGKRGSGVCLKFNLLDIACYDNQTIKGVVAYETEAGLKSLAEQMPSLYPVLHTIGSSEKISIEDKISNLATLNLSFSPFMKFEDYKYEKEFRLVYFNHYGVDCRQDASTLLLSLPSQEVKPFVNIPIPSCSFGEVILGPSTNAEVMSEILKRELQACGLSINVRKSKIPFQIL